MDAHPTRATRHAWINGALRSRAEAALPLADRGARDGEGLFETILVRRRRPIFWDRHMERLVLAAAELGFPVPPSPTTLGAALDAVLAADGLEDAAARITVTRGAAGGRPTRTGAWVEAEPLAGRRWAGRRGGGARAIVSRRPFEPGPLGRYKTTSRLAYHLAREEARIARVDEALLATAAGELLEGSTSNLFVVLDGAAVTPPLACGILPGITRALVLSLCPRLGVPAREERLDVAVLDRAEEAFVTNAIQGVVPLVEAAGRSLRAGPVGERLSRAWDDEVERLAAAVG